MGGHKTGNWVQRELSLLGQGDGAWHHRVLGKGLAFSAGYMIVRQ